MADWNVLLHDHHGGYISWPQFEENQKLLLENAHMKKRAARKSARGGRALLTGLMRCGRCGRMMRVFYGMAAGHAHRYQCRGDYGHVGAGLCVGIGGVRVDRGQVAPAFFHLVHLPIVHHGLPTRGLVVEEVEVRVTLARPRDRPVSVGFGAEGLVPESAQALGEAERDDRVVLSDEDAHRWRA